MNIMRTTSNGPAARCVYRVHDVRAESATRTSWGTIVVAVIAVFVAGGLSLFLLSPSASNGVKVAICVKDAPTGWPQVNVPFWEVKIHVANSSSGSGRWNPTMKTNTVDIAALPNV